MVQYLAANLLLWIQAIHYIPVPGHLCEMEGEVKVGEHLVLAHLDVSERAQFFQTVEERAVDSISTNNLLLFCPSTPGGSCW